jgi:hypothetical protein
VFQEALTEILSRLEAAQNRRLLQAYALIGGFAVSAWGVPRATNDISPLRSGMPTLRPLPYSWEVVLKPVKLMIH